MLRMTRWMLRGAIIAMASLFLMNCGVDCPSGQSKCGDVCVNTQSDRANCGACGTACPAGQVCNVGQCAASCQSDLTDCNGSCADTKTNTSHCGACGNACASGERCDNGTCVGNSTECPTGTDKCGDACYDLQANARHCGACDNACADGESCTNGSCTPAGTGCSSTNTKCGDACVNTDADRNNCGSCGTKCAAGEVCNNGTCSLSCQSSLTDCSGNCVNVKTDRSHCGACGNQCDDGLVCDDGKCVANCPVGQSKCDGQCADYQNDRNNCGSCGRTCKGYELCRQGRCESIGCNVGFVSCGGACVDLTNDRDHCGACGTQCKSGEVCANGKCAVSCQSSLTKCGNSCVDTRLDRNNCGFCGVVCGAGQVCLNGQCRLACPPNMIACSGGCVNVNSDRANCGACGIRCASGQVCDSAQCVTTCTSSRTNCSGNCVDTTIDPSHCGACGNACKRTETCKAGKCELTCPAPFTVCGGRCVSTSNDRTNCGACGTACKSGELCVAGTCQLNCPTGQSDCNGTCANTNNNPSHCGACGNACASGEVCDSGQCKTACQAAFKNCSNSCVDTSIDAAHCGACGNACAAGETCLAGTCTKACAFGEIVCAGSCSETNNDPNNCGACGNACAAGESCLEGKCQPCRDCPLWAVNSKTYEFDAAEATYVDAAGNSYLVGTFEGTGVFGTTTLTSNGSRDVFVAKVNPRGNYEWIVSGGGIGADYGTGVVSDSKGNVYITGYFRDKATFGSDQLPSEGSHDIFVAKLDKDGKWMWAKSFGSAVYDKSNGIAVDSNDRVTIAGSFAATIKFGSITLQSQAGDVFVARLDDTGKVLWATAAGGSDPDEARAVVVDAQGNTYITGQFTSPTATFGSTQLQRVGEINGFFAKLNTSGAFVLAAALGGAGNTVGNAISIGPKGNVLIAGSFSDLFPIGGQRYASRGSFDFFVGRWTTNGQLLWFNTGGGPGSDHARGVAADSQGRVYVTGLFQGRILLGKAAFSSRGGYDIFVGQLDDNGAWMGASHPKSSVSASGNDIVVDSNDQIYVAGQFNSLLVAGRLSAITSGDDDAFLFKYPKMGTLCLDENHAICGSTCTNTHSNNNNCGGCGQACGNDKVCNAGVCSDCTDCNKWLAQAKSTAQEGGYGSINAVAVDSSGNVYVTGDFNKTVNFGSTTLTSAGAADIFVAKADSNGQWMWAKRFGSTTFETAYDIKTDSKGNVYFAGYFINSGSFGSTQVNSNGGPDAFVAKIDASGKLSWVSTGGGDHTDIIRGIAVDANGSVYVTGSFASKSVTFGTKTVNNTTSTSGSDDTFVARLDPSGKWLWITAVGSNAGDDNAKQVAIDGQGNAYVVGSFLGKLTFDANTTLDAGSTIRPDVLIYKVDASGKRLWATQVGSPSGNDIGNGIVADSTGRVYVAGQFEGAAMFGNTQLKSGGGNDIFVGKLATSGTWDWIHRYGSGRDDIGRGLAINSKGEAILVGTFQNTMGVGLANLTSPFRESCFVAKISDKGLANGAAAGGGTNPDYCYGVAIAPNDDILLAGYSFSSTLYFRHAAVGRGVAEEPSPFVTRYNSEICPSVQAHKICNGVCTRLTVDFYNCGKCGNTCASGEVCQTGVCQ